MLKGDRFRHDRKSNCFDPTSLNLLKLVSSSGPAYRIYCPYSEHRSAQRADRWRNLSQTGPCSPFDPISVRMWILRLSKIFSWHKLAESAIFKLNHRAGVIQLVECQLLPLAWPVRTSRADPDANQFSKQSDVSSLQAVPHHDAE